MALSPPIINQPPVGLLGFLGMKNGGENPSALSNVVAPTLDMLGWMRWATRTFDANVIAVNSRGVTPSTVIVPSGEAWLVEQLAIHVSSDLTAGQSIRAAPVALQGGTTVALVQGDMASAVVGERMFNHWTPPWALVLAPGTTLGVQCEAIAAGPINVICRATFVRCRV